MSYTLFKQYEKYITVANVPVDIHQISVSSRVLMPVREPESYSIVKQILQCSQKITLCFENDAIKPPPSASQDYKRTVRNIENLLYGVLGGYRNTCNAD